MGRLEVPAEDRDRGPDGVAGAVQPADRHPVGELGELLVEASFALTWVSTGEKTSTRGGLSRTRTKTIAEPDRIPMSPSASTGRVSGATLSIAANTIGTLSASGTEANPR